MAITTVDKIKINKYLKENNIDDICYLDMCDALGKRGKISDTEFLDYFTDYVVNDFRLKEKISIKNLTKVVFTVGSFLQWVTEAGSKINESTLDKIRSFNELYNEYLNRTGANIDLEFNDNCIGYVLNKVNELYPCEERQESNSKYINEIEALNDETKELKKKLDESIKLYDKLQATYTKTNNNTESLNKKIKSLTRDLTNKDDQIFKLNKTIEFLEQKIEELEVELSNIKDEKVELEPYKEKYTKLLLEVEKLKGIIEDDIAEKTEIANIEIKRSNIENLIYEKLLFNGADIDELIEFVKKKGIATDREEIYNLLKNLRSKINIDDSSFSLTPTYKVVVPNVLENGTFTINVPKGCKHYDILLVADFHIGSINEKVLSGFDIINEYCVKNNINLVLNLGDFYDGLGGKTLTYDSAIKNYKLVEESIKEIPKASGIYHGVLGGNHEINISKYGFDPIKLLTREREDFINLGYTHSTINLNSSSNLIGSFDIHHPDTFDFPVDLDDDGIDIVKVENYLKNIYKKQGRNRDDSYIDLFGHTHRNQLNYPGSYCFIPKYFDGNCKKGANHLRIYFDDDKQIKYMVFMPLIGNGKLFKANEIVYQKVLKK